MNQNQATQLFFDIFNKAYSPEYFKDKSGKEYLSYVQNENFKNIPVKSESMKHLIISIFKEHKLGHANRYLIDAIIDQIKSNAFSSEITKEVFIRYGRDGQNLIIDLGENGYCIVTDQEFKVTKSVNIPFYKPQKMLNLPIPFEVDIDLFLKKFKTKFNFENDNNYLLVLAYIIKAFAPKSGANPILIFQGLQGTGKTTASRVIKKLIDPSHPLLFAPPNNILDIVVTANSSYLIAFDNLSGMNAEMADIFCRISSGTGFTKRGLYTDDEEKSYDISRPTLINGIDELTTRPDFLDRTIIINLSKITSSQRKSESRLEKELEDDYPILFSGLVTLLTSVIRLLPSIQDSNLPRMTELARFGIAIEKSLGLQDGIFLKTFELNSLDKSDVAFWNDEMCIAIYRRLVPRDITRVSRNVNEIRGTISQIREKLNASESFSVRKTYLTKTVKGFSGQLKRIEPLLNSKGIFVDRLPRTATAKEIIIKMTNEEFDKIIAETLVSNNDYSKNL